MVSLKGKIKVTLYISVNSNWNDTYLVIILYCRHGRSLLIEIYTKHLMRKIAYRFC